MCAYIRALFCRLSVCEFGDFLLFLSKVALPVAKDPLSLRANQKMRAIKFNEIEG